MPLEFTRIAPTPDRVDRFDLWYRYSEYPSEPEQVWLRLDRPALISAFKVLQKFVVEQSNA